MRRIIPGIVLALTLAAVTWAGPLENGRLGKVPIAPGGTRILVERFEPGEKALAIISGNGASCLAGYVFDHHGNCVDFKDLTTPGSFDDVALQWFPSGPEPYAIEIRNLGVDVNVANVALR